MLDPVSIGLAISTASKAFDMIQRGFAVGRELEQMHGDMGRWMSATAEIAATAEDAENAGFITRMLKGSGNIESIATQAVLAKKQIEKQRYQLMVHVRLRYGMNTWDEILRAEGNYAKQSQGSRRTAQVYGALCFNCSANNYYWRRFIRTLELGGLPKGRGMKMVTKNNKYIVYDQHGKLVIMTRIRDICERIIQDGSTVSLGGNAGNVQSDKNQ
jgi:hypothetical protein